ncbi:basic salivary proline-rich protein 1 [Achroia grisella]|uniref:basic salivary proline-rich protein 1 n=1 Tax=Achroia grisella TaxID=688607 RepID=UPI0027D20907|nr:basic salivary proline-rich protein 1 [Achroia grisella]
MRAWAWWFALMGAMAGARELDPAACATRFDVQRDKIIRTEESRDMGARYLSELDVGARQECLRLCCETDTCDVFVYEEKSPGSCYMFNCGPPEDFRCKFTAHSNFSSGVLALSRRLAELQDQERLAHHEHELASLRTATSTTSTTTKPVTIPPPPPPLMHPQQPEPPQIPTGRCSRYQFECRRGGECIAVYNACDGVPQCADGSDEAPELACPPSAPAQPPPPPATSPPSPPPKHIQVQESADSGVSDSVAMEGGSALGGERWPHRLAQAQPQHRYNDAGRSSHIFSHKGGLLQDAEPQMAGPGPAMGTQYGPPFEPPWPRRPWGQPQTGLDWGVGGGYARPEWSEPDPRRAWPVPQPRPDPEMTVYIPPKTMPEMPMVYTSQQQTLRDSPKKGFDLEKKPEGPEATLSPPAVQVPDRREETPPLENTTKKKVLAEKATPSKSEVSASRESAAPAGVGGGAGSAARAAAPEPVAVHEHYAADEHDGLSEHPPSAILLLVLGIAMTTVMAAMVGCRARAARRRLRRGKSPFAHDADYLVNGMYL